MGWWSDIRDTVVPVAAAGLGFMVGGPAGAALAGGLTSSAMSSATAADANKKATDAQVNAINTATAAQTAAADKQTNALITATQLSVDEQKAARDQARTDSLPWLNAGTNALARLDAGVKTGGEFANNYGAQFSKPFTQADFQASPGYAFRQAEGQKAIDRSLAARGGVLSGNAVKKAMNYNQQLASEEYSNAYNRWNQDQTTQYNRLNQDQTNNYNKIASLAGVGQTTANLVGAQGQGAANAMSNAYGNQGNQLSSVYGSLGNNLANNAMAAGNARASGYVNQSNIINRGRNGVMSNILGFLGR